MPSAKILEAKKALVADLNEKIAGSLAGVVVAYNGISVADDTKLRKELREAGVHYLSLIHISEPTRLDARSRMPSSA